MFSQRSCIISHFGKKAGVLVVAMAISGVSAEIVFQEDFDEQPDWTSGMHSSERAQVVSNGDTLPENWFSTYQDPSWAPSLGHPDAHESIEILSKNSSKARGGVGKSYVGWRDSTTGPGWRWNSDSQLTKYFPEGYDELFVEFWIKFSPDWTPNGDTGITKLFRISHWNGEGSIYGFGSDRSNGPVMIWDYEHNSYGSRLNLTTRGYPIATNYVMTRPEKANWPREAGPMNFDNNIRDLDGDGLVDNEITKLLNLTTGDPVSGGVVPHDEIWGDKWHKIQFHVKMNSQPGVLDGELWMWIDDQLVVRNVTMPWAGYDATDMPKWNIVSLGGNSHFHAYPDEKRREEWYSIDDLIISTERFNSPNPPSNVIRQSNTD